MTSRKTYLSRALKTADWFAAHMIVEREPSIDANHGRVFYNYHVPSRTPCLGIGWSSARAAMVLLAAYEATKREGYLESAVIAGEYMKQLQVLDERKSYFGIFREETVHSDWAYVRDSTEVADALAHLARVTGDREYLYRLKIFWEFYEREGVRRVRSYPGPWPWCRVIFAGRKSFSDAEYHGGSIAILYRYWRLTRQRKWLDLALELADTLVDAFFDERLGALVSRATTGHHGNKGQPIENDDGCGASLVCVYKASGRKRYLQAASAHADYLCNHIDDLTRYAAPGIQAIFLMEMYALTRRKKYREAAAARADIFLDYQVMKSPDTNARYGFRGEDENPKWYYEGARKTDFVVTRTSAYSAIALFKLAGRIGPYYSAFGWK